MKRIKVLLFISMIFYSTVTYSQGIIVDDFSQKALPGWIWGGVEMKYSHNEDNKENGFADIYSKNQINSGEYIGKIVLKKNYLFTAGNYINIMLKGVKNDATVIIKLLYDIDSDKMLNNDKDMILSSSPVSLNFEGWKEIKLKIDQDNFKINSSNYDNFEVTEENVYGVQLDFEAGNQYAKSVFESGIALISEIPNKEALSFDESGSSSNKESYFNATNTPNPFNPATKITYTLPQSTYVTLSVYDRLGRQVEVLIDQNQESGEHSAEFNASNLPSGIYFYRIKTPEKTEVRKMIFAK